MRSSVCLGCALLVEVPRLQLRDSLKVAVLHDREQHFWSVVLAFPSDLARGEREHLSLVLLEHAWCGVAVNPT